MSRTLFSVASMRVFFASGTVMSAMEIVMAPWVEYLKPSALMLSSTSAEMVKPYFWMQRSMMSPSCFLPTWKPISWSKACSGSLRST